MPDDDATRPADPLLLLPLRLDYRVVEAGERITLGSVPPEARGDTSGGSAAGPRTVSALGERSPLRFQETTADRQEIWFRWYPDEPFALDGIAPASAEEQAARADFLAAVEVTGADWFDADDPAVAVAWQTYTAAVGVHRGIHLLREADAASDDDTAPDGSGASDDTGGADGGLAAIGRIVGLPDRVALFGLSGSSLVALGHGEPIRDELRYTPEALDAGDWLTSFPDAVAAGMGTRLTDPERVSAALAADWVIAVGVRDGDATEVVETYLRDAVANGTVELLAQDTPTNNSDEARTDYEPVPEDPVAALRLAAQAERRAVPGAGPPTDADILAAALGVDTAAVLRVPGAGRTGVRDARAMATALLPGLVDVMFTWLSDAHVSRDELIDFIAEHASARGPLPVVRLDTHPFGVLPIMAAGHFEPPDHLDEPQRRVFELVHRLGEVAVDSLQKETAGQPVIEPGAPDNSDRLNRILRLNPVGKRVDVVDAGDEDAKPKRLRCPLVEGPEHAPGEYVGQLQATPLADLPDPDRSDQSTPLLYRLLRLALERTVARLPEPLRNLPLVDMAEQAPADIGSRLAGHVAALDHLRELPRDRLEVLLMEVLDLLHHRHDAWLTAIASSRLTAQRRQRAGGLRLGYYGFLGTLRPASVTGGSDGYIQTPNLEKAVTAALLRSAGLRHGASSAFDLDLSSRRVRRALALVDLLREGLSPREVLGYRAERWLHDQRQDLLIHQMRARYPLPQGEGSAAHQERLLDGLALAEGRDADLGGLTTDQIAVVGRLRAQLADDLDAVSDLTMAEAVHQMAIGNNAAANAWINVLSGEPVPSSTAFVSTRRDGHGSTHRVSLVLDPDAPPSDGDNPREVIEPAIGRLAARLLDGFDACAVGVSVPALASGDAAPLTLELRLGADLGMMPVDVVVGGRNEVTLRARYHVVRLWQTRTDLQAALGELPAADLVTHVNQVQPISLNLGHGTPSAEELLAVAGQVGRLLREGRPLEATDLNAALPPSEALTEAELADVLADTIRSLVARAETLSERLAALLASFGDALGEVRVAAAEAERLRQAEAPAAEIEAALQRVSAAREALEEPLLRSSRFGLPEALLPFAAEQLEAGAANEHIRRLEGVAARLADKRAQVDDALASAASTTPSSQRQAEELRAQLVTALQAACDGDGLPVLPPFRRQAKTSPTLTELADVRAELQPHEPIRPRLRSVSWLVEQDPGQRAWRARDDATADTDEDDAEDTVRSEAERPRSRYVGLYLGRGDGILGAGTGAGDDGRYAGLVVDEWSELRPSMLQTTGMALNYDAPQSQPPHALLLGVASEASHTAWTAESAAALVQEAIRLMQTRALPSGLASRRNHFGTLFNVVPPASSGKRLPTVGYRLEPRLDELAPPLEAVDAVLNDDATVHAVIERHFTRHRQ